MRIDPTLCHVILVAIESDPQAGSGQFLRISVEGYEPETIAHHIKYLYEKDLISDVDVTHLQSPCVPEIAPTDITADGRTFLDQNEPEPPPKKMGFV